MYDFIERVGAAPFDEWRQDRAGADPGDV